MDSLYTEVLMLLLGPGETRVSKKEMESLLLGLPPINWICGSMEVTYRRNYWVCSVCWMTKVSSTYFSYSLGGLGTVLMALDVNYSVNRLATRGLMGEPMAAPWTYLYTYLEEEIVF